MTIAPAGPRARVVPQGVMLQGAVLGAALAVRLTLLFRQGTVRGSFGYDSSVYFAASDALVQGRMPYRDFTLLHPPMLTLVLTPFAALTHFLSDPAAFAAAAISFAVLGAVNAVLVVRVCWRLGLSNTAAALGGGFYAVWFGAVHAEYLARLEPLGNFLLLCGMLFLLRSQRDGPHRHSVMLGATLALLVSTKIWWTLPAVALLVWHQRRGGSSKLLSATAGVATGVAVVDLPFLLVAPRAMWSSVVTDQLTRQPGSRVPFARLTDILSVSAVDSTPSITVRVVCSLVASVLAVAIVRAAWRLRAARPVVVLLCLQTAIVLASPSWFGFYTDYLAVMLALVLAAAASTTRRRRLPGTGVTVLALAGALTIAGLVAGTSSVRPTPGGSRLAERVASVRCVMSDSPMGLIELNALTRGLRSGCPNWVDVTGRTYGVDRAAVPRSRNQRWQRDLRRYLRSGDAVIIVRAYGTGLSARTRAAIRSGGVMTRTGDYVVYRRPPRGDTRPEHDRAVRSRLESGALRPSG